ncbi:MAG: hypothetical protein IPK69_03365 [Phycisphaerales bacterium]|nr:MAG: hypothetical protein IPK69_03365 [Phycisphaerales bacterium]
MEAKGLPGIAEILTGRIERNPPRYYEMRLERVEREIAADTSRLDLYDDAGVACDRIGRSDEAIEWMAKKREVLDGLDANREDVREHEYRYHANLGTFHAHRWLRAGARRDDLGDLKAGEREISRAIEINPEAHFGREKYQLAAIRWLMELPAPGEFPQPVFLQSLTEADGTDAFLVRGRWTKDQIEDAIRGISGLMVLGNAWESVDMTWALGACLDAHGDASLAYLAKLRVRDLIADGKSSFHLDFDPDLPMHSSIGFGGELMETYTSEIDAYFARARAAAAEWTAGRDSYMEARFAQLEHPDSSSTFWDGWGDEPKAPEMPNVAVERPEQVIRQFVARAVVGVVIVVVIVVVVLVLRSR